MLKILHTYPKGDTLTARYLSLLSDAMRGRVECATCDEKADFRRLYEELKPDIVHQHGPTTVTTPANCRRVITANGAAATAITTDSHAYYAVIARSQIEARRLKLPRTEVILNPLITKTTTFEEAAAKTLHVYRRVMDSNPLEQLDADSRHLLATALKVGLLGDKRWASLIAPLDSAASLSASEYKVRSLVLPSPTLHIYAELEGVGSIFDEGLRLLDIAPATKAPIDNYLPEGYTPPVSMRGRTIVEMVRDISQGHLSLLRLTDLLAELYDPHLNEHELLEQLENNELKPLFQSLLQLLSEQLLLDEGFMPCSPVDNSQTQQLRTLLLTHLKL